MSGDELHISFIKAFKNLEGVQISERKQCFYKLLKNTALQDDKVQLELAVKHLRAETYLESLFNVEFLIYYRRTTELLDILKEGNELHISKIIKQSWFFEEVFKNMQEGILVNEFLPQLSFTIRMKVLKKISRSVNEKQMDKIFMSILERYGLDVARNFLASCSTQKIKEVIENNQLEISSNQLKGLFDKDPELIKLHLDILAKQDCFVFCDDKVLTYIAQKNPSFFLELLEKEYVRSSYLGKRTSCKVIDSEKTAVLEKFENLKEVLNKEAIAKKLKSNFNMIYSRCFPKQLHDVPYVNILNVMLKYIPKSKRWNVFADTFQQVYKENILQHLNLIRENFVNYFPNADLRYIWAAEKYKETENVKFLQYYDSAECFRLIKEKVNVTSKVRTRHELLITLLKVCKQNNDLNVLKDVLQYFSVRHKNEDDFIRSSFLDSLWDLKFDLEDFGALHWQYINELIERQRITKTFFQFWRLKGFLKGYLVFLYMDKQPLSSAIDQYMKDCDYEFRLNLQKYPEIEKHVLTYVMENFKTKLKLDEEKVTYCTERIIHDVINYNKSLKNGNEIYHIDICEFSAVKNYLDYLFAKYSSLNDADKCLENELTTIGAIIEFNISYSERAIKIYDDQALFNILHFVYSNKKSITCINNVLTKIIGKRDRKEWENMLLDLVFSESLASQPLLEYFFKNELNIINKYFNNILKQGLDYKLPRKYILSIKQCSHLNLDEKLIIFCNDIIEKMDVEHESHCIEEAVNWCSLVMPTSNFIELIEKHFLPIKGKLDLSDVEQKQMYQLKCNILKYFKNILEPTKMLNLVAEFCIGDYLQSCLQALYSVSYRSSENSVLPLVFTLSMKAVSTRKHALHLATALLSQQSSLNIFYESVSSEKNISSKKHLFSTTLKMFLRSPSQILFDQVLKTMNEMIDKNDTETFQKLVALKMPPQYHPMFLEKCWYFFDNLAKEVKVESYLLSLLKQLNSRYVVEHLSYNFVRMLIEQYYFEETYFSEINKLVFEFLASREDKDLKESMKLLFQQIKRHTEIVWNSGNPEKCSIFFKIFQKFAEHPKKEKLCKCFGEHWNYVFERNECFNESVFLDLLNLKVGLEDYSIDSYAKKTAIYLANITEELGLIVVDEIYEQLAKIIESKYNERFAFEILKSSVSSASSLLAILLLQYKCHEDLDENLEKEKKMFREEVISTIENIEDDIVKIHLSNLKRRPLYM